MLYHVQFYLSVMKLTSGFTNCSKKVNMIDILHQIKFSFYNTFQPHNIIFHCTFHLMKQAAHLTRQMLHCFTNIFYTIVSYQHFYFTKMTMELEILLLMCSIIRPLQNCLTTSKIHHTAELWTVKTHVVETSTGFQNSSRKGKCWQL